MGGAGAYYLDSTKGRVHINVSMAEFEAELSLEDLSDVQEELYVARTKWYKVGLRLKVPVDILDCIRKEFDDAGVIGYLASPVFCTPVRNILEY